jgi:predicted nucleic-acid-binding protein
VKITADTNILVRAAVMDDRTQGAVAAKALLEAESVAVTLPCLCEFVWVLMRGYGRSAAEVAAAIRNLIAGASVLVDRPAVEAGLAILDRGGDFADGVIAFEGRRLGGRVFTSFDREAVGLIEATGGETRLLSKR